MTARNALTSTLRPTITMRDITAAIPRSSSACVSVRFVMACPPEAPASAAADAGGIDGRHSELVLGVGVGHGGGPPGPGAVERAHQPAEPRPELEEQLDHCAHRTEH